MARKKIVWLCSWYPNRNDPFDGDFIQRHARAAAAFHDIYVIYVAAETRKGHPEKEVQIGDLPGLTEHRIYFPGGKGFWGRVKTHYRWLFLYKQALRNYMVRYGKPDLVHIHIPMKAGIAGLWLKKRYQIPYLISEHWGIYNDSVADRYSRRNRLFRYYTEKIFRKASGFISVSRYLGEAVKKLRLAADYWVIPNVTDTTIFFPAEKKSTSFRFIHVSNMVDLKNVPGILRAFKKLYEKNKDVSLLLIGDRDPAIRALAATMDLPEAVIEFRGEIPYEQVGPAMQDSDCLLLFSQIENSPCVIGEALCCGIPVIATKVGGIPELVDQSNGILVQAGNEVELTEAMRHMIDRQEQYPKKDIAGMAMSRFGYKQVGAQFDRIYSGITGKD